MNHAELMKDLLRPLGVYKLDNSFLGAELDAMGWALDRVEEHLEDIQREMCLITARDEGLENMGRLFAHRPVTQDAGKMAQALAALNRIGGDSFTLAAINNTIVGCGLNAAVAETNDPGTVNVRFPNVPGVPAGFQEISRIIEDILPAHLQVQYLFWYVTWEEMEEKELTWQRIHDKALNWQELQVFVA